jgi:hypothetical protein
MDCAAGATDDRECGLMAATPRHAVIRVSVVSDQRRERDERIIRAARDYTLKFVEQLQRNDMFYGEDIDVILANAKATS